MGALLGVSVELSTQSDNTCLLSVGTLFESVYLIYYYMNEYQVTSEEDNAAYAFSYILKLFRSGFDFDCSGGIDFNHIFTQTSETKNLPYKRVF